MSKKRETTEKTQNTNQKTQPSHISKKIQSRLEENLKKKKFKVKHNFTNLLFRSRSRQGWNLKGVDKLKYKPRWRWRHHGGATVKKRIGGGHNGGVAMVVAMRKRRGSLAQWSWHHGGATMKKRRWGVARWWCCHGGVAMKKREREWGKWGSEGSQEK